MTSADDIDFPHATRAMRIRRDGYDITGIAISKEVVPLITSLPMGVDSGRRAPAPEALVECGE